MIFAVVLCAATVIHSTTSNGININNRTFDFPIWQAFAFPNIDIADEDVVGEVLAIEDITPEQRKCIETAVADAKKKDPAFGKWIDQVDQARQVLKGKAKKCHELGNILQQK